MDSSDMNMAYEMFVRQAFRVDRWGDPAHLANADVFAAGDINEVKAGAGYAMAIFNLKYVEETPSLDEYCSGALKNLITAENKQKIYQIIVDYNKTVRGKY